MATLNGKSFDVKISEEEFQNQIIQLARLNHWRIAHFRPAMTSQGWRTPMQGDKGFPDLVLAKKGRIIFAELKSNSGKLSEEQRLWMRELDYDPNEYYIWCPFDLDEIIKVLEVNRDTDQD